MRCKKFIIVGFLLSFLFLLSGCGLFSEEEQTTKTAQLLEAPEPRISTTTVERGTIARTINHNAQAVATQKADLYFTQGGRVEEIFVNIREQVEKGQKLASLDTEDLEHQYKLIDFDFQRAKLQLERAKTLDRSEISEYDLKMERISFERTKMRYDRIVKQIEESTLYAPFDGKITGISIQEEDRVGAYQQVMTLENDSEMELQLFMSDQELLQLVPGLQVNVDLSVFRNNGEIAEAKVVSIPSLRTNSPVIIELIDEEMKEKLKDISRPRVEIILEKREEILLLDEDAVITDGDRSYVQVMDNGIRRELDIAIGLQEGGKVEILEGLEEGDEVII